VKGNRTMFTIKSSLGYAIDFPELPTIPACKDGQFGTLEVESIPPAVLKTLSQTPGITVDQAVSKPEPKPEPPPVTTTPPTKSPEKTAAKTAPTGSPPKLPTGSGDT
jgi:hypothetical protein